MVMGFISWRVHEINQITGDYISNHRNLVEITTDFSALVVDFQSFESRSVDADYAETKILVDDFENSVRTSLDAIHTSDNHILKEQAKQSTSIYRNMLALTTAMNEYGRAMTCSQNVYKELIKNSETIGNIDLTIDQDANQVPNIDGLQDISGYLSAQSSVSKNYTNCLNADDSEEVFEETEVITEKITTYSSQLQDQSQSLIELIGYIENNQLDEAEQVSTDIASKQALLYDLSPEASIFVPSSVIDGRIEAINELIVEYNDFNDQRNIIE
jgi:hypothetical protein